MKDQDRLAAAIGIAVEAHAGQTRENGDPYILHPMRVMMKMDTTREKIVAILHDVFEDTETGFKEVAFLLEIELNDDLLIHLKTLTKPKNMFYSDYIHHVGCEKFATKIKLADLEDNLNLLELHKITDKKLRRARKYKLSHDYLSEKSNILEVIE